MAGEEGEVEVKVHPPQQRVVMIQDASREVNLEAIMMATKKFSLKSGDQLTIVPILDWFSSPSTFSCFGRKRLGYMMRVDSNYFISTNKKVIEEHSKRWLDLRNKNPDFLDHFKKNEIAFRVEVLAGPATDIAYNAVREFQATRLVLDKRMHKEIKHNLDKFSCRLYKIKGNNSIERLKPTKLTENNNSTKPHSKRNENATNSEMIQPSAEEQSSSMGSRSSTSLSSDISSSSTFWSTSEASTTSTVATSRQQIIDNVEEQVEFKNGVCSKCKNRRPRMGTKIELNYSELYKVTGGFSQKNFLSEGGFGAVYKGKVSNGMMVAVKQHKNASFQGEKEFKSEVSVLREARHENVLMLLGSCSEGHNRLLVYEYVCNGSLDQHLSQHSRSPLSWKDRIKVAIGAGRGLLYLHSKNIIHRDLRPNNILVTHDYLPLVGDFGLARTQNQDSIHSTEVVGTLGYLAPEYAECGKVSTKTDVYSFGVVLLELITGMRTNDKRLGGRSLVGWARPLLRERNYPDLIDERVKEDHDIHQLFWMVRLAEKCLSRDPHKRLTMAAVVNVLSGIVEGSTCIKIKEHMYSPARSDSFYSDSDSDNDLEDELHSYESESELPNHQDTEESTASDSNHNTKNQMMQLIVRQPPSPPICT
ncbi:hypothetical protein PIB30_035366 [Stylosanthes scabra]|uniref:Protein kinase domain-containing protein n=1 Tax=Stylosanthes scabra TaxID=79078 RepID=A0ABU6XAM3_9FABA|nr:hypothetical protein [Stylosanthes scabra]